MGNFAVSYSSPSDIISIIDRRNSNEVAFNIHDAIFIRDKINENISLIQKKVDMLLHQYVKIKSGLFVGFQGEVVNTFPITQSYDRIIVVEIVDTELFYGKAYLKLDEIEIIQK